METWKPISSNNMYYVSDFGRIWSTKSGVLKTPINNMGYPHFNLLIGGKPIRTLVHRVVCAAFYENLDNKRCVNHKNGIKNDNRVGNLEWVTHGENHLHAYRELGKKNNPHPKTQKPVIAYNDSLAIPMTFSGIRECARFLNIPYQAVQAGIKLPTHTYFGWKFKLL
jgi:hypothetical protein